MTPERGTAEIRLASMRVLCLVSGHKWTPAAEAPDPHDPGAPYVKSYAGDTLVLLVCRRCGHPELISTEDFRQFVSGDTSVSGSA